MKFGLLSFVGLLAISKCDTIGGTSGYYCDRWNPCATGYQCVDKKCSVYNCSASVACDQTFECIDSVCIPLKHVYGSGEYCDSWTFCQKSEQCVKNRCVPLDCIKDTNCAYDFHCANGKCIANIQVGSSSGYCDQWTACNEKDQCVDKKCVPFKCNITPDCAQDYVCYDGKYCIQINNNHTRGRYCDAEHECDILHKCEDNQCVWK